MKGRGRPRNPRVKGPELEKLAGFGGCRSSWRSGRSGTLALAIVVIIGALSIAFSLSRFISDIFVVSPNAP